MPNLQQSSDPEIDRILSGYVKDKVREEATRQGVPVDYADRQASAESAYRPDVIKGQRRSSAGAVGPMQLIPATAKDLKVDPFNINQNIEGGIRYSKQQLKAFGGDQRKAAAAYNWGPGNVQKYGTGRAPAETQDYIRKVAGSGQQQSDPEIDRILGQYQSEMGQQPQQPAKTYDPGYGPWPEKDSKGRPYKPLTSEMAAWQAEGQANTDRDMAAQAANITEKPAGVAPSSRNQRAAQAAQAIAQINQAKQAAQSLFAQADQTQNIPTGQGVDDATALRQRAEYALERANELGRQHAKRFPDLIEVGFGNDTDPNGKMPNGQPRQWVYAKPKAGTDTTYEQTRQQLSGAQSARRQMESAQRQQRPINPLEGVDTANYTPEQRRALAELDRFSKRSGSGKAAEIIAQGLLQGAEGAGQAFGVLSQNPVTTAYNLAATGKPAGNLISPAAQRTMSEQQSAQDAALPNAAPIGRGVTSAATQLPAYMLLPESKAAQMLAGGAMTATQQDWRDPGRAALNTGIGAVAGPVGASLGASIGAPIVKQLTSPVARAATEGAAQLVGGAAGSAIPSAVEQLVYDGKIDPQKLAHSAVIGAAQAVPGLRGPKRIGQQMDQTSVEQMARQAQNRAGVGGTIITELPGAQGKPSAAQEAITRQAEIQDQIRTANTRVAMGIATPEDVAFLESVKPNDAPPIPPRPDKPIQQRQQEVQQLPTPEEIALQREADIHAKAAEVAVREADIPRQQEEQRIAKLEAINQKLSPRVESEELGQRFDREQSAARQQQVEQKTAERERKLQLSQDIEIQSRQQRNRALLTQRDIAETARDAADSAIARGDHETAIEQLARHRKALMDLRAAVKPVNTGGVRLRDDLTVKINQASDDIKGVNAQVRAMARAKTAPLPNDSKSALPSTIRDPQSDSPLLRPEAQINPEGGIPKLPENSVNFARLAERQNVRQAEAPAERGPANTEDLTIAGLVKRRLGGFRVSDRGEARVLGGREGNALVGLVSKDSPHGTEEVAHVLHEQGRTLDDGRPFVEDGRVVASEADVLDYMRAHGKEKVGGTNALNDRLAQEEADYYENRPPTEPIDRQIASIDLREKSGEIDAMEAQRERNRLGIDPQYTEAPVAVREPLDSRNPYLVGATIERDGAVHVVRDDKGGILAVNANREAAIRNATDTLKGGGDFAIDEDGRSVYAPGTEAKDVTPAQPSPLWSVYRKLGTSDPEAINKLLRNADRRFKKSATPEEAAASVRAYDRVSRLTPEDHAALASAIPDYKFHPVNSEYQGEGSYGRHVRDISDSEQNAQLDANHQELMGFFDEMAKSDKALTPQEIAEVRASVKRQEWAKSAAQEHVEAVAPLASLLARKNESSKRWMDLYAKLHADGLNEAETIEFKQRGVRAGLKRSFLGSLIADAGRRPADAKSQNANAERTAQSQATGTYGRSLEVAPQSEVKPTGQNSRTGLRGAERPAVPQVEVEPRAVVHDNPAINGRPIVAERADGKVVVANPENKTGVSVVKDQSKPAISPAPAKRGETQRGETAGAIKSGDAVTWKDSKGERSGTVDVIRSGYATIKKADGASEVVSVRRLTSGQSGERDSAASLRPNALGFYSQLERAIEQKMPAKASAAQVRAIIENPQNGVKPDEVKWSGLDDYLNAVESLTKEDVLKWIRANRVDVQEVEKGRPELSRKRRDEMQVEANIAHARGDYERSRQIYSQINKLTPQETKFSEYVLPGAKEGSYRELLLTLPEVKVKKPYQQWLRENFTGQDSAEARRIYADQQEPGQNYKSSHFDESNILAHIRFNERTDAEGKRVLHIEEIQSDWHQEGRKKGYKSKPATANDIELRRVGAGDMAYWESYDKRTGEMITRHPGNAPEAAARREAVMITQPDLQSGVPDAPFKKTWHEIAFKRALRYAAENGYDKMTWTTGEQQADRFDLSKQVDSIDWLTRDGKTFDIAAMKNGEELVRKDRLTPEQLEETIGKDAAQKVIDRAGTRFEIEGEQVGTLKGLDLKVGGEGMKGFYDQILPAFASKYAKKWGARVGEARIDTDKRNWQITPPSETVAGDWMVKNGSDPQSRGLHFATEVEARRVLAEKIKKETVHSISITPAMRESVMQGQPLFNRRDPKSSPSSDTNYWQTPALERPPQSHEDAQSLIANARAEFRPRTRSEAGTVWTNQQGAYVIGSAMRQLGTDIAPHSLGGVNLRAERASEIADLIRDRASAYGDGKALTEIANHLDAATTDAKANGKSHVVIADSTLTGASGRRALTDVKQTVREERFHGWQREAGLLTDERGGAIDRHFAADPIYGKIRARLIQDGYDRTDAAGLAIEAPAKLASGQAEQFGLTPEQAHDFLFRYAGFLTRRYGTDVTKALRNFTPSAKAAFEDAADIAGQRPVGADRGRALQRPGAAAEGQGAGESRGSAASLRRRENATGEDGGNQENRQEEVRRPVRAASIADLRAIGNPRLQQSQAAMSSAGLSPESPKSSGRNSQPKTADDYFKEQMAKSPVDPKVDRMGDRVKEEAKKAAQNAADRVKLGKMTQEHADNIKTAVDALLVAGRLNDASAIRQARKDLHVAQEAASGSIGRKLKQAARVGLHPISSVQTAVFGTDFSYVGRQAAPLTFNPLNVFNTARAFKLLYNATGREEATGGTILPKVKGAEYVRQQLESHPRYDLANRAGLELALTSHPEEIYQNNIVSKLPWVKRMEAGNEAFLDYMRLQEFGKYADAIDATSQTQAQKDAGYRRGAAIVNDLTGRADLGQGKLKAMADATNGIFSSPRLNISHIKLLDPTRIARELYHNPAVGQRMLKDATAMMSTMGGMMALGNYTGIWSVGLNPDDSDFLKFKIGNTRYDPGFGELPLIRLFFKVGKTAYKMEEDARLGTAQSEKELKAAAKESIRALGSWGEGRLGPLPSYVWNLWKGQDFLGRPVKLSQFAHPSDPNSPYRRLLVPASAGNIGSSIMTGVKDGFGKGAVEFVKTVPTELLGIGTNTYERTKKPAKGAASDMFSPSGGKGRGSKKDMFAP